MLRLARAKLRDAVDAVGVRQLEIQKDDVGIELRRQAQTLGDGAGRAHDVDVALALEHRRDAFAHDRVILDDEDLDHRAGIRPRRTAGSAAR